MRNHRVLSIGLAVLISLSLLLPGCSEEAPATPSPSNTSVADPGASFDTIKSPDYGVQTFLWGSPAVERDLKLAQEAGFGWIKQMFQWNYIEGDGKGQLAWGEPDRLVKATQQEGLKIVARVDIAPVWSRHPESDLQVSGPPQDLQDFGDFMYELANRYKKGSEHGRIHAYEIWNEPNLAREWGGQQPNAKEYVDLLKAGYEAVKKADPEALVITAGLAPTTASGAIAVPDVQFLQEMYEAGAKDYFDMLGVHGAGYKAEPEMSPDEVAANPDYNFGEGEAGRIYCFRHIEDLRQVMIDNGDEDKKVAVMEFGWTSDDRPGSPYQWHAVTEQQKAEYIARAYQYAAKNWTPWIGIMSVIYICNPQWGPQDEQYYWCITNPDGTVRPAYDTIKRMSK